MRLCLHCWHWPSKPDVCICNRQHLTKYQPWNFIHTIVNYVSYERRFYRLKNETHYQNWQNHNVIPKWQIYRKRDVRATMTSRSAVFWWLTVSQPWATHLSAYNWSRFGSSIIRRRSVWFPWGLHLICREESSFCAMSKFDGNHTPVLFVASRKKAANHNRVNRMRSGFYHNEIWWNIRRWLSKPKRVVTHNDLSE